MKRKKIKKIENRMLEIGIDLNKLESLSRILLNSIRFEENLKDWDAENLSQVLLENCFKQSKNLMKLK